MADEMAIQKVERTVLLWVCTMALQKAAQKEFPMAAATVVEMVEWTADLLAIEYKKILIY